MEEKKDIKEELKALRNSFSMDPPVDSWKRLDADLERQRALQYRQIGNRFKLISIGLFLLLIFFVSYNFLMPDNHIKGKITSVINSSEVINDKSNSINGNNKSSDVKVQNNTNVEPISIENIVITKRASLNKKTLQESNNLNERNGLGKETNPNIPKNYCAQISNEKTVFDEAKGNEDLDNEKLITRISLIEKDSSIFIGEPFAQIATDTIGTKQKITLNDSIKDLEKNRITHWLLSVFYGPNVYARNRLKILNQQFASVINSYNTLSTQNYSFNSGLMLGYRINNNWSVSSGGIYSTIAYTSNYPTLHASIGSDNLYHYKYHTSCGTIEVPNDDNVVLTKNDTLKSTSSCSQVIKVISIPLLVKYQINKGRFSVFGLTGISTNLIVEEVAKINVENSNYTLVNHVTGLRKTNYSYIFDFGMDYNLNNGMSIFAEPAFTTNIISLTENNFFNCYPFSFGIRLGLTLYY